MDHGAFAYLDPHHTRGQNDAGKTRQRTGCLGKLEHVFSPHIYSASSLVSVPSSHNPSGVGCRQSERPTRISIILNDCSAANDMHAPRGHDAAVVSGHGPSHRRSPAIHSAGLACGLRSQPTAVVPQSCGHAPSCYDETLLLTIITWASWHSSLCVGLSSSPASCIPMPSPSWVAGRRLSTPGHDRHIERGHAILRRDVQPCCALTRQTWSWQAKRPAEDGRRRC